MTKEENRWKPWSPEVNKAWFEYCPEEIRHQFTGDQLCWIKSFAEQYANLSSNEWEKALVSLTAGGSEFCGDSKYCVEHVKDRLNRQQKKIKELIIKSKQSNEPSDEQIKLLALEKYPKIADVKKITLTRNEALELQRRGFFKGYKARDFKNQPTPEGQRIVKAGNKALAEIKGKADEESSEKLYVIKDEDSCKCKPLDRICDPPSELNRGKIRGCGNCQKPLATRFQETKLNATKGTK